VQSCRSARRDPLRRAPVPGITRSLGLLDTPSVQAYSESVFRLWWAGESVWRHNRLHVFVAAVSLLSLTVGRSFGTIAVAAVAVGSLLVRIVVWDLSRTGSRLALRREPRQ
jgi:hypothetical protein